jgi:heme oxygenase
VAADAVTVARQVSFSAELRGRTRDDHEQVERWLGLPDRLTSVGDLARLLHGWREIWADVRAGCGPAGHDESARLLVSSVRAVQQSAADLRAIAMIDDSDDVPRAVAAEAGRPRPDDADRCRPTELSALLATEPGVWAVSYVLRGSRVGGSVLAPLITRRLGLPEGVATDYHGDVTTGRSWVTFRARLDAWGRVATPSGRDAVLGLTRDVFDLVGSRLLAALPPEPEGAVGTGAREGTA